MNTLQICSIVVSGICVIITTCLAWIMMFRKSQTEVTFSGTPVDKKEFERHVEQDVIDHNAIHSRLGGIERGVEARVNARIDRAETENKESRRLMHREIETIGKEVAALKTASDLANQRSIMMDAKLDRLIEKSNES
jgi:hypothetical protein